jgi:hypothetical protein
VAQLGPELIAGGHPLISEASLTVPYLARAVLWTALIHGLAHLAFPRRDL